RRRQRHARSPHEQPRPGIRPIQQNRALWRGILLPLSPPPHHRRRRDVAARSFTPPPASSRPAPATPPRRTSPPSRASLSPRRFCDSGGIRRSRWSDPRFSRGARRPRAGLLDAIGPARVHGGARRLLQLLRPDYRRVRLHAVAGSAAIADPVLAFHSRRR